VIVLDNGDWLCPSFAGNKTGWETFVNISADGGVTWEKSEKVPIDQGSNVRPTVWESLPGKVHMLFRTPSGSICRIDSEDGGHSWGQARATSLSDGIGAIDLAKLTDGEVALAHIISSVGGGDTLVVSLSEDNGETWPFTYVLDGDGSDGSSNPAVVTSPEGISIAHTSKGGNITFRRLSVEHLKNL
jgi:predicted neuraminidase